MKWKVNPGVFMILLMGMMLITSCYEPVEGCLDTDARNYNVNADDACNDCCTLPEFDLLISYLLNGESYSFGNDTIVGSNSSFVLNDFHLILSGIALRDVVDSTLTWEDVITLYNSDGSVSDRLEHNFRYFSKSSFRGSIKGMRYAGNISSLDFLIGLPEDINFYNKDSLDQNTELDNVPSQYYSSSNGYQFYSFTIEDLEGNTTTISNSNSYPLIPVTVDISPLDIIRGFDAESNISLDFGVLFEGIDLIEMNDSEIKDVITNNFPGSFKKR